MSLPFQCDDMNLYVHLVTGFFQDIYGEFMS